MTKVSSIVEEIIKQSNLETEKLLSEYPHTVCTKHLYNPNIPDDFSFSLHVSDIISHITDILEENFDKNSYKVTPTVMGKYRHLSDAVFFKNSDDAMMFRLMI